MAAPAEARPIGPNLDNLTPKAAAALVRQHIDAAETRTFLRSSPARLLAVGILVFVLCILVGVVSSATAGERRTQLQTMLAQTEPFAMSAQRLYSSLSVADAAASTAFISGGLEPVEVRESYQQAIAQAAAETTGGAAGDEAPGSPTRVALSNIAAQLPIYAGLVETARTNNRLGLPVGAAYLGEASNLMQNNMLPMAEQLYQHRADAVTDTLQRYEEPPWKAIALLTATLAVLLFAQVYLLHGWRRVFNPGLVLASFAILALLVWMTAGASVAAADTHHALDEGSHPLGTLTHASILAQQARSSETLKLSRRDTTGQYDQTFDANAAELRDVLGSFPSGAAGSDVIADAQRHLDGWIAAHGRMNDAFGIADYTQANTIAIGPGPDDSMANFTALEAALERGMNEARDELRNDVANAARMLDGMVPGALLLSIVAGVFVGVGLWPRMREYR